MFRAIAALALASTSAQTSPTLVSTAAWWERVTVTVNDSGQTGSCRYETSLQAESAQSCDVVGNQAAMSSSSAKSGIKSQYTRITFERRFTPAEKPIDTKLQPGDTFLGGQVMALAIDAAGGVNGCKVVATSGSLLPEYGCEEAAAERFEASAGEKAPARQGYMTILVYAHEEHLV